VGPWESCEVFAASAPKHGERPALRRAERTGRREDSRGRRNMVFDSEYRAVLASRVSAVHRRDISIGTGWLGRRLKARATGAVRGTE